MKSDYPLYMNQVNDYITNLIGHESSDRLQSLFPDVIKAIKDIDNLSVFLEKNNLENFDYPGFYQNVMKNDESWLESHPEILYFKGEGGSFAYARAALEDTSGYEWNFERGQLFQGVGYKSYEAWDYVQSHSAPEWAKRDIPVYASELSEEIYESYRDIQGNVVEAGDWLEKEGLLTTEERNTKTYYQWSLEMTAQIFETVDWQQPSSYAGEIDWEENFKNYLEVKIERWVDEQTKILEVEIAPLAGETLDEVMVFKKDFGFEIEYYVPQYVQYDAEIAFSVISFDKAMETFRFPKEGESEFVNFNKEELKKMAVVGKEEKTLLNHFLEQEEVKTMTQERTLEENRKILEQAQADLGLYDLFEINQVEDEDMGIGIQIDRFMGSDRPRIPAVQMFGNTITYPYDISTMTNLSQAGLVSKINDLVQKSELLNMEMQTVELAERVSLQGYVPQGQLYLSPTDAESKEWSNDAQLFVRADLRDETDAEIIHVPFVIDKPDNFITWWRENQEQIETRVYDNSDVQKALKTLEYNEIKAKYPGLANAFEEWHQRGFDFPQTFTNEEKFIEEASKTLDDSEVNIFIDDVETFLETGERASGGPELVVRFLHDFYGKKEKISFNQRSNQITGNIQGIDIGDDVEYYHDKWVKEFDLSILSDQELAALTYNQLNQLKISAEEVKNYYSGRDEEESDYHTWKADFEAGSFSFSELSKELLNRNVLTPTIPFITGRDESELLELGKVLQSLQQECRDVIQENRAFQVPQSSEAKFEVAKAQVESAITQAQKGFKAEILSQSAENIYEASDKITYVEGALGELKITFENFGYQEYQNPKNETDKEFAAMINLQESEPIDSQMFQVAAERAYFKTDGPYIYGEDLGIFMDQYVVDYLELAPILQRMDAREELPKLAENMNRKVDTLPDKIKSDFVEMDEKERLKVLTDFQHLSNVASHLYFSDKELVELFTDPDGIDIMSEENIDAVIKLKESDQTKSVSNYTSLEEKTSERRHRSL